MPPVLVGPTQPVAVVPVADLPGGPAPACDPCAFSWLKVPPVAIWCEPLASSTQRSPSEMNRIRPGIAYVDIQQFNENTSKELNEKLKKLGEKDIRGLILDLRGNPGGLLNEGVEVAGHFLKRNELVVSHRGRAQPNKNYFAHSDNGGKEYPVVVLVNRLSASAAENRFSRQQPPFHHCGRLAQISRIGVVLMLPTTGMP